MDFLDFDDMQIHSVSTTPSLSSSGASWRFVEEFHSNPDSDIEFADDERDERPRDSNMEPIFRDNSVLDLEDDDDDVPNAENYPRGENNHLVENNPLENPWRMGASAFHTKKDYKRAYKRHLEQK